MQVIDNNTSDEALWRPLEAECERLRAAGHQVEFVHLPSWPGYKAGALNWGREHLAPDVEIVGVVDADYVVEPRFLRQTVPFFTDPAVAFVQTPQDYREWEESAFYRACYAGFAYFFKVGMVSRAHRNAIIFAGTMGLLRRSVLDEIGGWDEAIITEDAEASLRILAQGYRAVYLATPFGRGIMPLTYEGLRKQRFRWAFGGIQILRRHWRALLPWNRRSGLTTSQRYDYLVGGLWWFNDALTLGFTLFVFAAGLGVLAGRPFVVQRLSAIGVVLPLVFIGLNLLRYLWAMRASAGTGAGLALAALRVNLSLSWVIALACVRGLVEERGVFLRTPKFRGSPAVRELRMVAAESVLAATGLALAARVLAVAGYSAVGLVLAALLGWSVFIYGSATGYALGDPTRAPLSEALRQKARLEIAPRVGRVLGARRVRRSLLAGLLAAVLLVAAGLAGESGRPRSRTPRPSAGRSPAHSARSVPSSHRRRLHRPPRPRAPPPPRRRRVGGLLRQPHRLDHTRPGRQARPRGLRRRHQRGRAPPRARPPRSRCPPRRRAPPRPRPPPPRCPPWRRARARRRRRPCPSRVTPDAPAGQEHRVRLTGGAMRTGELWRWPDTS